jgi:hypothetical protein
MYSWQNSLILPLILKNGKLFVSGMLNLDPASTLQFSRYNAEKSAGSGLLSESAKFLFDMN